MVILVAGAVGLSHHHSGPATALASGAKVRVAHPNLSRPLRVLVRSTPRGVRQSDFDAEFEAAAPNAHSKSRQRAIPDAALQLDPGAGQMPAPEENFEGMSACCGA